MVEERSGSPSGNPTDPLKPRRRKVDKTELGCPGLGEATSPDDAELLEARMEKIGRGTAWWHGIDPRDLKPAPGRNRRRRERRATETPHTGMSFWIGQSGIESAGR